MDLKAAIYPRIECFGCVSFLFCWLKYWWFSNGICCLMFTHNNSISRFKEGLYFNFTLVLMRPSPLWVLNRNEQGVEVSGIKSWNMLSPSDRFLINPYCLIVLTSSEHSVQLVCMCSRWWPKLEKHSGSRLCRDCAVICWVNIEPCSTLHYFPSIPQ